MKKVEFNSERKRMFSLITVRSESQIFTHFQKIQLPNTERKSLENFDFIRDKLVMQKNILNTKRHQKYVLLLGWNKSFFTCCGDITGVDFKLKPKSASPIFNISAMLFTMTGNYNNCNTVQGPQCFIVLDRDDK